MLFNSAWFFLFFPAVSLVFAATPAMARIWVLVAAGAVFYMALAPEYIVIPIAMIATCYLAGRAMEDSRSPRWRKAVLVIGLSIHLAILFSFKYAGFALSTAEQAARLAGFDFTWTVRNWILPVGLSFQTFQGISYLMEVYWRNASPERSLGAMALYFLFYPQLPSGPISTPQALLTQFHGWRRADREKAGSGLRLMAWGLFKAAVVARRMSFAVNIAFDDPSSRTGIQVAAGAALYLMQLYCEFSGYCDIGRGAARTMGIDLANNFRAPFNSISLREFWRRWNVSLAHWLRDYVFYPCGGGRRGKQAVVLATMAVFLVSGVWHGAQWSFILWGLLNGVYCCVEYLWEPRTPVVTGWRLWARRGTVYGLVAFSMLLFRAGSADHAFQMIARLPAGWDLTGLAGQLHALGADARWAAVQTLYVGTVLLFEGDRTAAIVCKAGEGRPVLRWACYHALLIVILFNLEPDRGFIYSQF